MADDIDIKEHDILDNPKIRQLLSNWHQNVDIKIEDLDSIPTEDMSIKNAFEKSDFEYEVKTERLTNDDIDEDIDDGNLPCDLMASAKEVIPINTSTESHSSDVVFNKTNILDKLTALNSKIDNRTNIEHFNSNPSADINENNLIHMKDHDYALQIKLENEESNECNTIVTEIEKDRLSKSLHTKDYSNTTSDSDDMIQNNKTMLGCTNTEVNDDKTTTNSIENTNRCNKLLLNVTVNLEDWKLKLEGSPRYCDECQILFPTIISFNAHKATHPFLKKEIYLNKNFTYISRRHKNITKKTAKDSKTETTTTREITKKRRHNNTTNAKVLENIDKEPKIKFRKLVNVNKTVPIMLRKPKENTFLGTTIGVKISKDLFKCTRCQLHVLTRDDVTDHKKNGCSDKTAKEYKKCRLCKLPFNALNLGNHVLEQHTKMKLKRDDFNIKLVDPETEMEVNISTGNTSLFEESENIKDSEKSCNKSVDSNSLGTEENSDSSKEQNSSKRRRRLDNILYKCTKCSTCFFSYNGVTVHNHNSKTSKCEKCGLKFTLRCLRTHETVHHEDSKLKLEDFIIRDFPPTKKTLYSNILYKCLKCNCCSLTYSGYCHHNCDFENSECSLCGYVFSKNSFSVHVLTHHEEMKLKREDFSIIYKEDRLTQERNVHLPLKPHYTNNLYKCTKCSCCYLTHKSCQSHNCITSRTKKPKCDKCGYMFTLQSLKRHKDIHHAKMKLKRDEFLVNNIDSSNIHELDDKYSESSNSDGKDCKLKNNERSEMNSNKKNIATCMPEKNILFKCDTCDCCFSNLKTAMNHKHDVELHECSICKLSFATHLLDWHMEFHHREHRLKLKDFVIKSCPNKSNEDCSRILYKCAKCNCCFITYDALKIHTQKRRCSKTSKNTCTKCNNMFTERTLPLHLSLHHNKMNLKQEEFLYKYQLSTLTRKQIKDLDISVLSEKEKSYLNKSISNEVLYKCTKCNCCFFKKQYLVHHDCVMTRLVKKTCSLCDYEFPVYSIPRHVAVHHEKMKLRRADFVIRCLSIMEDGKKTGN